MTKFSNSFYLFLIIFLYGVQVICADDIFDVAEKYNKKKNLVVNIEVKKRAVLADIYKIERDTRKLVLEKTDLNQQKAQLDHQLNRVSKEIVGLERKLSHMAPELIERVAFLNQIDGLPWFYAFMTSQSLSGLDQLSFSAQKINIEQTKQIKEFSTLHDNLEKEKVKLLKTAQNIVKVQRNIAVKEKNITRNQGHKKRALKKLNSNLVVQKRNLKRLKLLGKQAVAQSELKNLNILFSSDFFDQKGKLPLPIEAPLIQEFGLVKALSYDQVELMSKGHFYQAVKGTLIRVVAPGRVRFSGKVHGWGQTVIVDHGGRYYSVYGNLKKTFMKKNQIVKAKDRLGVVGSKHTLFKQGLYFEIRHFSEPQDPKDWLKRQSNNLATL